MEAITIQADKRANEHHTSNSNTNNRNGRAHALAPQADGKKRVGGVGRDSGVS